MILDEHLESKSNYKGANVQWEKDLKINIM
jgi:hypothetical protein